MEKKWYENVQTRNAVVPHFHVISSLFEKRDIAEMFCIVPRYRYSSTCCLSCAARVMNVFEVAWSSEISLTTILFFADVIAAKCNVSVKVSSNLWTVEFLSLRIHKYIVNVDFFTALTRRNQIVLKTIPVTRLFSEVR